MSVAIGEALDDRHRIERILGSGAMGVVVEVSTSMGDAVVRRAAKIMHPFVAADPDLQTRFRREARAMNRVQSPHAVKILNFGYTPAGAPFILMEFLEGEDLDARLEREGPQRIEDATAWVVQALHALAAAHDGRIVHRDVKPANLFLANVKGRRIIKVVDFGISKDLHSKFPALTQTMAILGSPLFLSPEQIESTRDVDHRTDIWSIGVTLYHLLTRKSPFPATSLPALFDQITSKPPVPLLELRADAPPRLWEAIARCLEKRPADRFQSCAELSAALSS